MRARDTFDGLDEGRREVKWSLALATVVLLLSLGGASRGRPTGMFLVDLGAWLAGSTAATFAALTVASRRRARRRQWGSPAGSLLRNVTCALAAALALLILLPR